ncbi:MAG: hypothetical protein AAF420_10395 [Pseudomonadota bacterium]
MTLEIAMGEDKEIDADATVQLDADEIKEILESNKKGEVTEVDEDVGEQD